LLDVYKVVHVVAKSELWGGTTL